MVQFHTSTQSHTFVTFVRDHPGVLNRAASVIRRHGINIQALTVTRTAQDGVSCMTWTVETADIAPVLRQLEKLVDVLEVRHILAQADGVA